MEDRAKFASGFLNIGFNKYLSDDEKLVGAWLDNTVNEVPFDLTF